MTTGQPSSGQLTFGLDDAQFGLRLKSPKLLVGPLELGLAANYDMSDGNCEDAKQSLLSIERFKPSLSVKDVFFRGKFEVEPQSRSLHYSKKFRVPFLNTELLKLRLTAQWPTAEAAGGLLGRAVGFSVSFQPENLHQFSVVRKAPSYQLELAPRVGPPQALYDAIGFPGSMYFKARTTLSVTDAATLNGVRADLRVHSLNAVIRLYDSSRVKPCRVGRNLARAARQLSAEELETEDDVPVVQVPYETAAKAAPPQPDVIDRLAAKSREWAHAVLINSCVATRNLQDMAAEAAEQVRSLVVGGNMSAGRTTSSS